MQHNGSTTGADATAGARPAAGGGVVCRLRNAPRVLGVAALAVPVVAGVAVFSGLPAAAGGHAAPAGRTDTVRLASEHGTASAPSVKPSPSAKPTPSAKPVPSAKSGDDAKDRKRDKRESHEKRGTHGDGLPKVTQDKALTAYFEAGYGYEDAVALAKLWHRHGDIVDVKVLAGRKLLAGRTLPVAPSYPPATAEDKAINAFLDAGYDYADAELLATLYGLHGDVYQAKVTAGSKLLAGGDVPISHGQTAWEVSDDAARLAYFNNGYGYDDAVRLATLWSMADPWDAKANAGHKLLDGLPLPVDPPAAQPGANDQQALDAFFANGFDWSDAVWFANVWHTTPYDAKVLAGDKILAGVPLPGSD